MTAPLGNIVQSQARPLRVTMLGLRGFPNVQGGVEHHVQHLACALADLGCEVEVVVRSRYVAAGAGRVWRKVRLSRLWAPSVSGVEALVHTFFGVLRAGWTRPDVLHIHAIGPALFAPLARILGLRVVVTHHSPNYENPKWNWVGRAILRVGERAGMLYANGRIAVSQFLADRMRRAYGVPVKVIPNGIERPGRTPSRDLLDSFGLVPNRYVLTVGRIDRQKCQLDLIAAFAKAGKMDWRLAIAGAADYSTVYACDVRDSAQRIAGVVLLGYQNTQALEQLYANAGVFVLPSSHEGQPIALLEALSYGCPVIVSDIPAHRDIGIPALQRVAAADVDALAEKLRAFFSAPAQFRLKQAELDDIVRIHDWRNIAQDTFDVYLQAMSRLAD